MMETRFLMAMVVIMVPAILVASWIDYRQHRVPNWLNLMLCLLGLAVQQSFFGWQGLANGFLGLGAGMALLIVPWAMHLMGAGDVKLLAAIGAWLGPNLVLWAFAIGGIIGGVMGMIMILAGRRLKPAMENLSGLIIKCSHRNLAFSETGSVKEMGTKAQLLPYGVPLTMGTLVVLGLKIGGWW